MPMYMFGQARGALREAMRCGAAAAAAIEARFEGREVYAAGRAAKRNLLVGYEQAGAFEDTELRHATEEERTASLHAAETAMAPGTNAAYMRHLRMLESWLEVVLPEEYVDLVTPPEGGFQVGENRSPPDARDTLLVSARRPGC